MIQTTRVMEKMNEPEPGGQTMDALETFRSALEQCGAFWMNCTIPYTVFRTFFHTFT